MNKMNSNYSTWHNRKECELVFDQLIEGAMGNCYNHEDNDVVYKDVVVIGNGPSGICMSYMLAGNWPYYTGEPHPGDEMLTARLHWTTIADEETTDRLNQNKSREETCERRCQGRSLARSSRSKLKCLSAGLEGRVSGKPLSLLMDQLQHPCVDSGLDVPSLLTWKRCSEHKPVDHVVLGKNRPGGAWQAMDPNVLTISLSRWMSLPDLDIREWEATIKSKQLLESKSYMNEFDGKPNVTYKLASRISAGTVAAYYDDYVRKKELEQYFRCGTKVTSVRAVPRHDSLNCEEYGWTVEGFETETGESFRYRCKKVILATGGTDLPNRLGVPGENSQWVTHYLNDLEAKLDRLVDRRTRSSRVDDGTDLNVKRIDPVLVIGAGLSAADAIMATRFRGIPVLHVFRENLNEDEKSQRNKYEKLMGFPSSMYPEYHKVFEMMADGGSNYPLYKVLPGYTVLELSSNESPNIVNTGSEIRTVTLSSPDGGVCSIRVSIVAILIGYKPNLSYLETGGIGLGRFADRSIDGKTNPIEVDDFTYEVTKAPRSGLYALGPLVGDNFVRYILGGAFGILAHALRTFAT